MSAKKIVYSSETGQERGQRIEIPREPAPPRQKKATGMSATGRIVVRTERSGRKGKTVTVAEGFTLKRSQLTPLAKELKNRCGTGGTARDHAIELQGDHRATLVSALEEKGYDVRRGN